MTGRSVPINYFEKERQIEQQKTTNEQQENFYR